MSEEKLSSQEVAVRLEQTIEQLQRLVVKLNTGTVETLPSEIPLQRLQEATQVLSLSLNREIIDETIPEETILANSVELTEFEPDFPDFVEETTDLPTEPLFPPRPPQEVKPEAGRLQRLLNPIRAILPTGIDRSLSDGLLAGILGAILTAALVGAFFLIYPQISDNTPKITENPPIIETPVELESPEPPQAVLLEPPPEPEISPEQRLIQAVLEDILDITRRYPEGLIDNIEAYFSENRLVVVLSADWYQLRPSRQDDVAKGIFQKAKNLDFQKLELVNQQGQTLARSPVVGEQMIIFRREP